MVPRTLAEREKESQKANLKRSTFWLVMNPKIYFIGTLLVIVGTIVGLWAAGLDEVSILACIMLAFMSWTVVLFTAAILASQMAHCFRIPVRIASMPRAPVELDTPPV